MNQLPPKDDPCATDTTCPRTYVSDYTYLGGYYGACNEELMMAALIEKVGLGGGRVLSLIVK